MKLGPFEKNDRIQVQIATYKLKTNSKRMTIEQLQAQIAENKRRRDDKKYNSN